MNDRRVTAAWWTSPDQRFGIAVGLERNATLRGGLARLARSQPAGRPTDRPTPCYAADERARGTRQSRPDKAPDMRFLLPHRAAHFNAWLPGYLYFN